MTQTEEKTTDIGEAKYNTTCEGTFVEALDGEYVFELEDGTPAVIDGAEYGDEPHFEEGEEVELLVEHPLADGRWRASARKIEKLAFWDRLTELADSDETIEGEIVAPNKGGLSVDIGLRAFCPRSQVDIHRVDDVAPYVGRRERFHVIQFDGDRCNVVLSRRKVVEKEREAKREETIAKLEPGQVFEGVVRNLKKYGAFVDVGGIDGLLHVSNMSWGRVDHPSEVVQPGDRLEVVVLDFDEERDRLSLGRKQLLDDPWSDVDERFEIGEVIDGEVVSLADFGAFVEVAPGLEGLVHVTELSWTDRVRYPGDVLEVGQKVQVKVVDIDLEERRISLSIKRLKPNPWEELAEEIDEGDVVEGPIRNVTDFGIFVEVAPSIEGLVHVSDFSWTERVDDPHERYSVGEEVEAKVLGIDVDNQKLSLGIKQLSEDPWEEAARVAKPGEKIEVEITRLADFGAFAEVVDGVEGLIHISELAAERVNNVHEVVRPGQTVEALVVNFDRKKQRIGLSLKRDQLGEGTMREYVDEEGATATLGDILSDQLDMEESDAEAGEVDEAADEADQGEDAAESDES